MTEEIAKYHAEALDQINSLYFTKSNYDDYYYGKGSAFPDVNGSVGILFEQASSRGHILESDHGILSFPFTIRNQVATSLSTQKAALILRTEMLEYKRKFFHDALTKSLTLTKFWFRWPDGQIIPMQNGVLRRCIMLSSSL